MDYVYVLQSLKDKEFYIGLTNNLSKRIREHNEGLMKSTKSRKPFRLVYYEGCLNRYDAVRREKFLKTGPGKQYIKNRIKHYLKN